MSEYPKIMGVFDFENGWYVVPTMLCLVAGVILLLGGVHFLLRGTELSDGPIGMVLLLFAFVTFAVCGWAIRDERRCIDVMGRQTERRDEIEANAERDAERERIARRDEIERLKLDALRKLNHMLDRERCREDAS